MVVISGKQIARILEVAHHSVRIGEFCELSVMGVTDSQPFNCWCIINFKWEL